MLNISKTIHNDFDEKMKKIKKSTEFIRKQELKRLDDIENRKLNQFTRHSYNISNIKDNIKKIQQKEKIKLLNVKENIDHLNRSFIEKQDTLYKKLNDKYKKQQEIQRKTIKYEEFIHRRKLSFDRFYENSFNNTKINNSRNKEIMKFQHYHNSKSIERNKILNTSRENIKYFFGSFI